MKSNTRIETIVVDPYKLLILERDPENNVSGTRRHISTTKTQNEFYHSVVTRKGWQYMQSKALDVFYLNI
jgi:hypothetical protein